MLKNYMNKILVFDNLSKEGIEIINVKNSKYNITKEEFKYMFQPNNYYVLGEVKNILNISLSHISSNYKNIGINIIKTSKGHYFFRKEQVDECAINLKNLISVYDAQHIYENEFNKQINSSYFDRNFNVIRNMPFFNKKTFIDKNEFRKLIDSKKNIDYISIVDFNKQLSEKFYGHKVYNRKNVSESIKRICSRLCLEYKKPYSTNNYTSSIVISKKTADILSDYFINNLIRLFKGNSNYYCELNCITKEMLFNDYYEWGKLKKMLIERKIKIMNVKSSIVLERLKINIIRLLQPINKIYFRKEEIDYWMMIHDTYTKSTIVKLKIEKLLGLEINKDFTPNFLKYRQIKIIIAPSLGDNCTYIFNKDISKLLECIKYENDLKGAKTLYEKYKIKITRSKIYNNTIPNTIHILDQYCLIKSGESRSRDVNGLSNIFFSIYEILCSKLEKELKDLSKNKLNIVTLKLVEVAGNCGINVEKRMILFLKYLKENRTVKEIPIFTKHSIKQKSNEPYEPKSFIKILMVLLNILTNQETIKKIIRDRTTSSSLLYVYLHFVLAWRMRDLLEKLPLPNLELINFNANSFLNWIENKNNMFTEEMGRIICCNIEEQVNRHRILADKNNKELVCIIPESMYATLGLLLCICEANRVYEKNKNKRNCNTTTLISNGSRDSIIIDKSFKKVGGISINEILGNGFSNIRAVKSFLTNISEKSEEFKFGAGYYYAQILRSHKNQPGLVSEVTKIYVNKDTSKASVNAFLTGTMSCVKYNILSLIDDKFEGYDYKEMESRVLGLNMTPYEIENTMKIIAEKCTKIRAFLNKRLTTRIEKDIFFKELLYGKKSYGLHRNTKCLFRVVRVATEDVKKIGITDNKGCPYNTSSCIGCEYFIALKYFIYEFVDRFNELIQDLEKSNTVIDIKMNIDRIYNLYVPMIREIQIEIGKEKVNQLLDVEKIKEVIIAKKLEVIKYK